MRKHKKTDYSIVLSLILLSVLLVFTIGLGVIMSKHIKSETQKNQEVIEYEYSTKTVDISLN